MGCDIHLYVEKKVGGKWVKKGGFVSDYYKEGDPYWGAKRFKTTDQPYSGRNYTVFAALADVRNGRGFAGCDTGDAIEPVSMPKGLPADASNAVRHLSDEYGCDGHSHSYLTLAELKAYNWDKPLVKRGIITLEQFKALGPNEEPSDWSGDIFGPGIVKLPANLALAYRPKEGERVHVQYQWTTTLRSFCKRFLDQMIPLLEKIAKGKDDSVRITFWFDN